MSVNLNLSNNNLISNDSAIYENNDFRFENNKKKLFENFIGYWSANTETIVKSKTNNLSSNYNLILLILFYSLFYFCISMIFFSKKLVNRI